MANWLTEVIRPHITEGDTVLDLCCGIGEVISTLSYKEITGIDAYLPYLEHYKKTTRDSNIFLYDLQNVTNFEDQSFYKKYDVVLWIDGIEHLYKDNSVNLLNKLEKIAKKKIIIFTPEHCDDPNKITLNHPKSAWGINDGDVWQVHKCALPRTFFQERGYESRQLNRAANVYDGSGYYEMIYIKNVVNNEE